MGRGACLEQGRDLDCAFKHHRLVLPSGLGLVKGLIGQSEELFLVPHQITGASDAHRCRQGGAGGLVRVPFLELIASKGDVHADAVGEELRLVSIALVTGDHHKLIPTPPGQDVAVA